MSELCQQQQELNTKINSEFHTLNQKISILEQGIQHYIKIMTHYNIPLPNLQDVYTGPITRQRRRKMLAPTAHDAATRAPPRTEKRTRDVGGNKKTIKNKSKSKYY